VGVQGMEKGYIQYSKGSKPNRSSNEEEKKKAPPHMEN
jgi:hypothetical protein